jgi:Protein of unknown function (DUF2934)
MSAATQMAPSSIPEEVNASMEQTFGAPLATTPSSRQAEIAQLAYVLWQQRGCPEESAEIDWLAAEQQLNG